MAAKGEGRPHDTHRHHPGSRDSIAERVTAPTEMLKEHERVMNVFPQKLAIPPKSRPLSW